MLRFLVSRLVQSVVVLVAIVTATFFLVRAVPGNPFANERKSVSPYILEQMMAAYGLDRPLHEQYFIYLRGLVTGELGPSTKYEGRDVAEIIADSSPLSFQLGLTALVIALVIGIPIGVTAAVRKNSALDYIPMACAMTGICLPTFVMGPLLALGLGIRLKWFNVAGWYDSSDWILPSLTLGLYYAAYIARMARGGMLEVLSQDYIRTARAKGASERAVVVRHALKSALTPVVAFLGPAMAGLVTGSFVTENVFQVPGLGQHFVAAARNSDYTLLQGVTVFYGAILVGANIGVDILQAWLNPRVRLSE